MLHLRAGYPPNWFPVLVGRYLLQHATTESNKTAIRSYGVSYTYHDLRLATDSYYRVLRASGIRHGDVVAVQMEPSFEAVAVLLACSEAGLVYVPCNADMPERRLLEICRRANARIFVVGPGVLQPPSFLTEQVPMIGFATGGELRIHGEPLVSPGPDRGALESDIAYVIFTSGSTGMPKGVVMSHRAATVAFRAIADACDVHDQVVSLAPLGFDLNLLDAAATLSRGKTLVYPPSRCNLHPRLLLEYLIDNRIEQLHCVPSHWSLLLRYCQLRLRELSSLRRTVTAGEELRVDIVKGIQAALPGVDIINCYGQTESICSAFYRVPRPLPNEWQSIPIGRAYPGAEFLLVDDNGVEINETDVVGEIYLRSAALFDGYWGAEELTDQVLLANLTGSPTGQRVYRTGDLAVAGAEGLTFVGRRDHQVQIYGNRVEPEEIERCLVKALGVTAAGVTDAQIGDAHLLIAAVVADGVDSAALSAHCRTNLPKYMIPAKFLPVDALPLSPAGKLDRSALRALVADQLVGSAHMVTR